MIHSSGAGLSWASCRPRNRLGSSLGRDPGAFELALRRGERLWPASTHTYSQGEWRGEAERRDDSGQCRQIAIEFDHGNECGEGGARRQDSASENSRRPEKKLARRRRG